MSNDSMEPKKEAHKVPRRNLEYGHLGLDASVPIIGLGCSSFSTFFWSKQERVKRVHHKWTPEDMDRNHAVVQEWIQTILFAIQECDITLLDTAPWYGHGTSEVVIGWAMEELLTEESTIAREDLVINTKVGRYEADPENMFDFSKETTLESVQRSIERMKCDYINVLQLHDPEFAPTLDVILNETIPAMMECRDNGWCRALGMTGYSLAVQYQILQASLDTHGSSVWDQSLVYGHFNLHDTSLFSQPLPNYCNGGSFYDFCHYHSMTLLAAAPLSMGLLTRSGPPPDWHPATQELKNACKEAAFICAKHNVDIATLALLLALSDPRIPCTLLGMKNIDQVKTAAKVAARFDRVTGMTDPQEIMKQVMTEDEWKVMEILQDLETGPFASVQEDGQYKWDGVKQAIDFWDDVDGIESDAWQYRENTQAEF
jgi:aryl-alcohol dehydrogenase-like predicted oxidoreductase